MLNSLSNPFHLKSFANSVFSSIFFPPCVQVGSITGNTNTVGGGAVWPKASLGDFEGFNQMIAGQQVSFAR